MTKRPVSVSQIDDLRDRIGQMAAEMWRLNCNSTRRHGDLLEAVEAVRAAGSALELLYDLHTHNDTAGQEIWENTINGDAVLKFCKEIVTKHDFCTAGAVQKIKQ